MTARGYAGSSPATITPLDDLVGLDLIAAMTPARRDHFCTQIGSGIPRPLLPAGPSALLRAGLAPFLHLPPEEPRTITRARMAEAMARIFPANGRINDEDLVACGSTRAQITDLSAEALRISRVAEMVI